MALICTQRIPLLRQDLLDYFCPGSMRNHDVSYPRQFYILLDVGAFFDYQILVTHLGHMVSFIMYEHGHEYAFWQ